MQSETLMLNCLSCGGFHNNNNNYDELARNNITWLYK